VTQLRSPLEITRNQVKSHITGTHRIPPHSIRATR
jgi:hypothetical protein